MTAAPATLSPAAMLVRAGMMHDGSEHLLSPEQMADLLRATDAFDESDIDRAWEELAGDPVTAA